MIYIRNHIIVTSTKFGMGNDNEEEREEGGCDLEGQCQLNYKVGQHVLYLRTKVDPEIHYEGIRLNI